MIKSRYYLINPSGVYSAPTRNRLDHKLETSTEESEYKSFGSDKVLFATDEDMTFLKDKKKLSMIPMERLYKKDNLTKYIMIAILILNLLNLMKK